jgi:chaperone modulatory protein CbpM
METRRRCRPASENGSVTMESEEFRAHANLDAELLEAWIDAGWLIPAGREGLRHFSEIDLARALLIKDLHGGLGINDEGIAVILHLVDQLHGLRHVLDSLMSALSAQPKDVRLTIAGYVRARRSIAKPVGGAGSTLTDKMNSRDNQQSRERRFT